MSKYQSIKVSRHVYRVPIPKRRMNISVGTHLSVANHKGRWVVALTENDGFSERVFRTCNIINRSEALKIIAFLSDYVNLVKPTEATVLNAGIRARSNAITRDTNLLTGLAISKEGAP